MPRVSQPERASQLNAGSPDARVFEQRVEPRRVRALGKPETARPIPEAPAMRGDSGLELELDPAVGGEQRQHGMGGSGGPADVLGERAEDALGQRHETLGGGGILGRRALELGHELVLTALSERSNVAAVRLSEKVGRANVIKAARGLGLMLGLELAPDNPALANNGKPPSLQCVTRLHEAGVLAIPSGTHVIRLLPPLNLTRDQAREGISVITRVVESLA